MPTRPPLGPHASARFCLACAIFTPAKCRTCFGSARLVHLRVARALFPPFTSPLSRVYATCSSCARFACVTHELHRFRPGAPCCTKDARFVVVCSCAFCVAFSANAHTPTLTYITGGKRDPGKLGYGRSLCNRDFDVCVKSAKKPRAFGKHR